MAGGGSQVEQWDQVLQRLRDLEAFAAETATLVKTLRETASAAPEQRRPDAVCCCQQPTACYRYADTVAAEVSEPRQDYRSSRHHGSRDHEPVAHNARINGREPLPRVGQERPTAAIDVHNSNQSAHTATSGLNSDYGRHGAGRRASGTSHRQSYARTTGFQGHSSAGTTYDGRSRADRTTPSATGRSSSAYTRWGYQTTSGQQPAVTSSAPAKHDSSSTRDAQKKSTPFGFSNPFGNSSNEKSLPSVSVRIVAVKFEPERAEHLSGALQEMLTAALKREARVEYLTGNSERPELKATAAIYLYNQQEARPGLDDGSLRHADVPEGE